MIYISRFIHKIILVKFYTFSRAVFCFVLSFFSMHNLSNDCLSLFPSSKNYFYSPFFLFHLNFSSSFFSLDFPNYLLFFLLIYFHLIFILFLFFLISYIFWDILIIPFLLESIVDGLPSLLYSSLKVSHYHLFCFSRICISFLFSSQSLLNLLTLFLISYVFSQISNLPSLSPPLSLFYLLLFPFLTSHAPFTPRSTRATTDFPPPRSVSLSKLRFPFPSATPTNARFTPIELSPLQCHPFSRTRSNLATAASHRSFLSFHPFRVHPNRSSISVSSVVALSVADTVQRDQSVRLPTSGAVDSHPCTRENSSRCQPRYHHCLFHDRVARDVATSGRLPPPDEKLPIFNFNVVPFCVSFLDKTILYHFHQCARIYREKREVE